jgi:PIN like domain
VKDLFRGFYRPSDEELKILWEECTFFIDANILLNLYRYPKSASEALLKVLTHVSSRLEVPYQAALEYQSNRLAVIAEQKNTYKEVRKHINDSISSLEKNLSGLQLHKRHSAINPSSFLKDILEKTQEFEKELSLLEDRQLDVYKSDTIRNELDNLLIDKVGPALKQEWLDKLYVEGKIRYENERPPGYADQSKSKEEPRLYGGLTIKREFGDLILWKEIIETANTKGIQKVIFVTDDKKEDWWWIAESNGKKTIGPRPELVEEILSAGKVENFWMYSSDRFMQFARDFLNVQIEQDSIVQAQNASDLISISASSMGSSNAQASLSVKTDEELNRNEIKMLKVLIEEGILNYAVILVDVIERAKTTFRSGAAPSIVVKCLFRKGFLAEKILRDEDYSYDGLTLTPKGEDFVMQKQELFIDDLTNSDGLLF